MPFANRGLGPALLIAIALLAGLLLATSCKGGGNPTPGPSISPAASGNTPTPGPQKEATRERDGIRMTLKIDRENYGAADGVQLDLSVDNTRSDDVPFGSTDPGAAGIKLLLSSDLISDQPLLKLDDPALKSGVLRAGDNLERKTTWDKQLALDRSPVLAPPGRYVVNAEFPALPAGSTEPAKISASVTFDIEGTPPIAGPKDVLQAAVSNQDVNNWASGRNTTIFCAYSSRHLYYNGDTATKAVAETFELLYSNQVDIGQPICSIMTIGDAWRVLFASPSGAPPNRLSVFLDLHSGSVLRVEQGSSPSPGG